MQEPRHVCRICQITLVLVGIGYVRPLLEVIPVIWSPHRPIKHDRKNDKGYIT